MKKIQLLALIMSAVTFLSLIGVGFSIWYNLDVILPNGDGTVTGNENTIAAYAVDKSSDVLKCDGEIEMFQYSSLSFLNNKNSIAVTYKIDTAKVDIWNANPTLTFSLTTKENTTKDNAGLFGSVDGTTKSFSASIGAVNLGNATVSADGKTISFTCKYNDIAGQLTDGTFTLTYLLNIPEKYADNHATEALRGTVGNFRRAFGQYLLSGRVNGDGSTTTTTFIVIAAVEIVAQ